MSAVSATAASPSFHSTREAMRLSGRKSAYLGASTCSANTANTSCHEFFFRWIYEISGKQMMPPRQSPSDEFHIWKPVSDFSYASHDSSTQHRRQVPFDDFYAVALQQRCQANLRTNSNTQFVSFLSHVFPVPDHHGFPSFQPVNQRTTTLLLQLSPLPPGILASYAYPCYVKTALSLFLLRYSYPFFTFSNLLYSHLGT